MANNYYVNPNIIKGFSKKSGVFNYKKLIILLNSINRNYKENDAHTCATMIRAVLDHIPPLLGFRDFADVANNYPWSPSHKKYMLALLDFKNEGDDVLHTQISEREDHLEIQNLLPTSNRLNTLLDECLINGGTAIPPKPARIESKPKITFEINETMSVPWANYATGFNIVPSFRVYLKINNFGNNKPDYISVKLKGSSNDGPWETQHFTFQVVPMEKPDKPYEIGPNKIEEIPVFLSELMPEHSPVNTQKTAMPNIDKDRVVLIITTASGIEQEIPIKSSLLIAG